MKTARFNTYRFGMGYLIDSSKGKQIDTQLFDFADTWQLVINTGTTIITSIMMFLIQRTQCKDSGAIHLKTNEQVASLKGPSNRLVDIEALTEDEPETLDFYQRLARFGSCFFLLTKRMN